jgi:hypothetical protein
MSRTTYFMNVDLDVYSSRPLGLLARSMERLGAIKLHSGRFWKGGFRASFEVYKGNVDADATIKELVRLVERLPPPARRLFDGAKLRDFSVGIQAGAKPFSFDVALSPAVLALVTNLGGRLSVTVYAPLTPEQQAIEDAFRAGGKPKPKPKRRSSGRATGSRRKSR